MINIKTIRTTYSSVSGCTSITYQYKVYIKNIEWYLACPIPIVDELGKVSGCKQPRIMFLLLVFFLVDELGKVSGCKPTRIMFLILVFLILHGLFIEFVSIERIHKKFLMKPELVKCPFISPLIY